MDLAHTAVVTGAASGLGAATARHLLAQGARVAAIDRHAEGLAALAAAAPAQVLPLALDVADAAAMEEAFERLRAHWGAERPARILVNCAGVLGPATLLTRQGQARTLGAFAEVLRINLVGSFNALRVFVQHLHDAPPLPGGERGVIVNTASVAAYEALSAQTAYGASKGGVAGMTLPLARELARYGIRVMAIAPGTFATGMFDHIPAHTRDTLLADVPFPARAGDPHEFALLAAHIVGNPMLNGEVIRLDGAVRMREPARRDEGERA